MATGGVAVAAPGTLAQLAIEPDLVIAGTPAEGTVTLVAVATSDTQVALSSTDTSVLTVPPSVTVPAGAVSATFVVTTIPFTGPGNFACVNGSPATGTLRFASVTDGALVSLVSSNPAVVTVPAETWVNGGQSTGAFPVTTSAVTATTTVVVTATAFGVSRTGTLTVVPATGPPVTDTVRITRAEWKRGLLRIEATSTNRYAILDVHLTVSGSYPAAVTMSNGGGVGVALESCAEIVTFKRDLSRFRHTVQKYPRLPPGYGA